MCPCGPLTLPARGWQANVTHYVIVDGYYHSSGQYVLSITCTSCPGGRATLAMPDGALQLSAPAIASSSPGPDSSGDGSGVAAGTPLQQDGAAGTDNTGAAPVPLNQQRRRRLAGHAADDGCDVGATALNAISPGISCSAGLLATGNPAVAAEQAAAISTAGGQQALQSDASSSNNTAPPTGATGTFSSPAASAAAIVGPSRGLVQGPRTNGAALSPNTKTALRGSTGSRAPTVVLTTDGAQHGVSTPLTFAIDEELAQLRQRTSTGTSAGGTASSAQLQASPTIAAPANSVSSSSAAPVPAPAADSIAPSAGAALAPGLAVPPSVPPGPDAAPNNAAAEAEPSLSGVSPAGLLTDISSGALETISGALLSPANGAATPPSAGMSAAADVLLPASSTPAAPGSTLANDAAVSTAVPAPLQGSAGGGGASGDGANVPRAPPSWYNAMLCRFVKALC